MTLSTESKVKKVYGNFNYIKVCSFILTGAPAPSRIMSHRAFIVRDSAKTPLLRMRTDRVAPKWIRVGVSPQRFAIRSMKTIADEFFRLALPAR